MFAVVRHPDIDSPGIVPQGALPLLEANDWYRVSDWRRAPSDFHLPNFANAAAIDAAVPVSEPEPEVPSKNDTEEI